jgi:exopolysaccharide biosynthesis polyprenyl glycosylphosphotransferase
MSIAVGGTGLGHSRRIGVAGRVVVDRQQVPWRRLAAGDFAALLGAWTVANLVFSAGMWSTLPVAGIGVWLVASQRLYATPGADMRTAELHALAGVSLRLAVAAAGVEWVLTGSVSPSAVATGSALSLVAIVLTRIVYRAWLRNARAAGRFARTLALVGIDEQARATRRQLDERPELGFTVMGAFGSRRAAHRFGMDDIWAGDTDDAPKFLQRHAADAVLVSTTAVDPDEIDPIVHDLLEETRCHIQLSTGLGVIDQRRLRPGHLDYAPVVSVDRLEHPRAQSLIKRTLDVLLGGVALLLALPVLVISAIAIKLCDRGPVLFRQARVGRDGQLFTVYKLRTMTIDAETRLAHLSGHNERRGPLFKMEQDPRVTKVGSLIRDLSIDELPQLWNVLRGDMSLVGPRPALPDEVEVFHDRLRQRDRVRPGMTGLWQVEARDNPSFLTYERLDLFYVENWSLGLDLTIMVATIESELARVAARLIPRARPATDRVSRPQLEPVVAGHPAPTNVRLPVACEAIHRSSSTAVGR